MMMLNNAVGILKSILAGLIDRLFSVKLKFFPSLPKLIILPWGDQWLAGDDYMSLRLRCGLRSEKNEQTFLSSFFRRGWIVFDIGAHHGLYTLLASRQVGPEGTVYSFEPSLREFTRLQEHLTLNRRSNVKAEHLALGEASGTQQLFVCQGIDTGCNSLRAPLTFGKVKTEEVSVMTLDEYVGRENIFKIDFLKLDVEGAELSVLAHAAQVLNRFSPVIMCELVDRRTWKWGYSGQDILKRLKRSGYRFFSFVPKGKLKGVRHTGDFDENILAVPECKMGCIESYLLV